MTATGDRIRVLYVDDDAEFADVAATVLERGHDRITVETATSVGDGLDRLGDDIDCIVSDYEMPGRNGIEFLSAVRETYPDLPFILFTGKGSETVASDAISAGATDYLQKSGGTEQYEVLANRITNAVVQARTERRLRAERERFRSLFAHLSQPTVEFRHADSEPTVQQVNPAFEEVFGYDAEEVVGNSLDDYIVPEDRSDRATQLTQHTAEDREPGIEEVTRRTADGKREFLLHSAVYENRPGGFAIYTDITEKKEQTRELERQNSRLTALFENFPEPTVAYTYEDGEPRVSRTNEAFATTFGYESDEATGEHIDDLVVPPDRRDEARRIDDRIRDGDQLDTVLRRQTPDGLRDFRLRNIRLHDDEKIDGYAIYVDVTDRKQRERELEAEREFIDRSLDTLDDIFYVVDTNGDFERWNDTLPERTGYSEAEIGSMNALEFFEGDHRDTIRESIHKILETGSHVTEAAITTTGGQSIPHEFRGVRMTDEAGNPTGIIGIARDITERKEREKKLVRQNKRLEEFARVISHDLRNPLNVASSRLELLEETTDSEHIAHIERAHERMDALIRDLLALAREGTSVSGLEPVGLAAMADGCWSTVETGGASLVVDSDRTVRAAESRLKQVFENLIRNAVEHGGDEVTVTVGDLADGFYIEDDGPGIPEADRENVFEAGHSTSEDGTGFGLSIVEQIVEAHGWDVSITESADGGARFEITGVEFVGKQSG